MKPLPRLALPVRQPSDVIPHLGKPTHWKQGRSAKAVADSWFFANGIPAPVMAILAKSEALAQAELIDGFVERQTDLCDGRGTPSQTDLLAVVAVGDELAIVGIEAKVDESFGPYVAEWIADGGAGKEARLSNLCTLLGLDRSNVADLRYQLLHRTAAAVLEARRYRATKVVMIVQSFCPNATGLTDFKSFAARLGCAFADRDALSESMQIDRKTFWLGWVSDVAMHG